MIEVVRPCGVSGVGDWRRPEKKGEGEAEGTDAAHRKGLDGERREFAAAGVEQPVLGGAAESAAASGSERMEVVLSRLPGVEDEESRLVSVRRRSWTIGSRWGWWRKWRGAPVIFLGGEEQRSREGPAARVEEGVEGNLGFGGAAAQGIKRGGKGAGGRRWGRAAVALCAIATL